MGGRAQLAWRITALTVVLHALTSCATSPTSGTSSSPTRHPEPALVLTPAQERAVAALRAPSRSRRGNPLAMLETTRDLLGTPPLPCAQVAEHLGIALPTFPFLQQRGFTTACGSWEGADLFEHPVPSASSPPPPSADLHSVGIAYLPSDVDLERTPFHEARRRGLVWMTIEYGGCIAQPSAVAEDGSGTDRSVAEKLSRADRTRLRWRNGSALGVQYREPGYTRLAWRSTAVNHIFRVSVNVPGDPVAGVALLREGVDIPT
ncbi:hypothetical protein [Kineococcus sp. G2]|uniref:hypothetical protein n=1 Tax=Kineococcus sp. G2 TaxID=3127484 RepID=UPI00301D9328